MCGARLEELVERKLEGFLMGKGHRMEAAPLAQDSVLLRGWEGSPAGAHLWTAFLPPEGRPLVPSTFQTGNRARLLKPIRAREWRFFITGLQPALRVTSLLFGA